MCLAGLKSFLEKASARTVEIVLTENSSRMVSVRGAFGNVALRLHRMFLSAPKEVLTELAAFICSRKGKTPSINRFIKERRSEISAARPARARMRTRGRHHDLRSFYDKVNAEYFGGSMSASITWSKRQPGRVRRRTLGSYSFTSKTIRINPVLDNPAVPPLFVEFVVYHEMLHAVLGIERRRSGRSVIHSKAFRAREKEFRDFQRATQWERANRHLL